jgi:hypothetical protein
MALGCESQGVWNRPQLFCEQRSLNMKYAKRRKPRLRVDVTGALLDELSLILSSFAEFAIVSLACATEIIEEFKNMVVRYFKSH